MNIVLVALPGCGETNDFTTPAFYAENLVRYPPLGLLAIAAGVDRRHQVTVVDAALSTVPLPELARRIAAARPEVVGFSVVTRRLYAARELLRLVRAAQPTARTVVGGPHPTLFPRETMVFPELDFAITGYAETAFPLLIEALANGTARDRIPGLWWRTAAGTVRGNPAWVPPDCLDGLPIPRRDLIDPRRYYTAADRGLTTTMYSSRGCPHRCLFCDVQDKRWRWRSATAVVDELAALADDGFSGVHIFDDTFNIDRQRALAICREIVRRRLRVDWSVRGRIAPFDAELAAAFRAAGGRRWNVGVETPVHRHLEASGKAITPAESDEFFRLCRRYRIETVAFCMVGFPTETGADREQLLNALRRWRPTYAYFNVLCPLPGTLYYRQLLATGIYPRDFWAAFARDPRPDFAVPPPRPPAEQTELLQFAARATREFYLQPRLLAREFGRALRYPRTIPMKARALVRLVRWQ